MYILSQGAGRGLDSAHETFARVRNTAYRFLFSVSSDRVMKLAGCARMSPAIACARLREQGGMEREGRQGIEAFHCQYHR